MTAPVGVGLFVWLPQYCEKGDPAAVAAKAAAHGVTWIALQNFCSASYVKALKSAGLYVAYSAYSVPGATETARFVESAKMARAAGVDGVLADAELEWEKNPDGSIGDRSVEALDFAGRLRTAVGADCWLADAGAWAEPKFHPTYPDAAFGRVFDAAMPERYWTEFSAGVPYGKSIAESEAEWVVTGRKYPSVVPVGCCYGTNTSPPGGHQALNVSDLDNFARRYPTFALWSWMHAPPWLWDVLDELRKPAPYTTPVAVAAPDVTPDLPGTPDDPGAS